MTLDTPSNVPAAIAAGRAVLRGEGNGTYDEAEDAIRLLIAEAQRKARPATLGERIRGLVRHQPLRALWRARVAWLLYTRWNRPLGDPHRMSLLEEWRYAFGLADMLDDFGYLSPAEAIENDRDYWED